MNPLLVRPEEDVFGGLLAGMTPKEAGDLAKPGLEYAGGLLDNIAEKAPGSLGRAWQGSDIRRMAQDALNTASYYAGPHLSDRAAAIPAAAAAATENMFGNKDAREASTAFREGKVGQGAKLLGLGSASALLDVPTLGTGGGIARGLLRGLTKAAHYTPDLSMAVAPIRAFHGSPFDFEKFDLKKIGTGEGAQAYGHGLYFAGNENVARQYRDTLAAQQRAIGPKAQSSHVEAAKSFLGSGYSPEDTLAGLKAAYKDADPSALAAALREANAPQGRMYEVGIHADPEKLLDWDRPLKEQPKVMEALDPILPKTISGLRPGSMVDPITRGGAVKGEAAWQALAGQQSPQGASDLLRQAGVPGIKYLDAGSRFSGGEGTRNYVTFSDDIVEILRKYGLAGAGVGLGGAMAMQPGLFPLPQQQ
jgi:hypothetical protein